MWGAGWLSVGGNAIRPERQPAPGVRERILESGEEWIYEDDYWDPLWDPDEERRPWTTTETTRWDDPVQGNNHAESEI